MGLFLKIGSRRHNDPQKIPAHAERHRQPAFLELLIMGTMAQFVHEEAPYGGDGASSISGAWGLTPGLDV